MKIKLLLLFLFFTSINVLVKAQYFGIRVCPGISTFHPRFFNSIDAHKVESNFNWEAGIDLGFKININNKIKEHIFSFSYINNYGGTLLYDNNYSYEFWSRTDYSGSGIPFITPVTVNYSLDYLNFAYRYKIVGTQGIFWEFSPAITYLLKGTGDLSNSSNDIIDVDISKDLQKLSFHLGGGIGMDFSSYKVPVSLSINYQLRLFRMFKDASNYYKYTEGHDPQAEDSSYLSGRFSIGIVYMLFNKTNK